MQSISQYLDRRYANNKYAGAHKDRIKDPNKTSGQYPRRMYRKNVMLPEDIPTEELSEEAFDLLTIPPSERAAYWAKKKEENEYKEGLGLDKRHRYGDQLDILKAKFTMTKEEVINEKFKLVDECRRLSEMIHDSCFHIPKEEKYVLGTQLRATGYNILMLAVRLKKKYYRKNMLEDIDVALEILRNLYLQAHKNYPEWLDTPKLDRMYNQLNVVGAIVGGLIKTSVV